MTDSDWLSGKVQQIVAMKRPTDEQKLLVVLSRKSPRSAAEERTFAALVRLEKAADRMLEARTKAARLLRQRDDNERKARNYRLVQHGLLIEQVGLADWDRETLLGALHEIAHGTPEARERWRAAGAAQIPTAKGA